MKEFICLNENFSFNSNVIDFVDNKHLYLVANNNQARAYIIAPEIDFYLKNSKNNLEKIEKLYEARALAYDYSKEIKKSTQIKKELFLNFEDDELKLFLENKGYKCINVPSNAEFYGFIGELNAIFDGEIKNASLALCKNESKINAVKNITNLSKEEILEFLNNNTGYYEYNSKIIFDANSCQLQDRRTSHCGWCAEICPTLAIVKDENKLLINDIDCVSCAKCVNICPTNALSLAAFNKESFWQISKLYENEQILVLDDFSVDADISGFLPFVMNVNLLDELKLLHLVNTSNKTVFVYSKNPSELLIEKISLINQIANNIENKDFICLITDLNTLQQVNINEFTSTNIKQSNFILNKRELFSLKILDMIKENDYGTIKAKNYALININQKSCTLCASCAGACNVSAIKADTKTNSIIFNASLCTSCGYCVQSCPEEDTIFMQNDIMKLNKSFFTYQQLAQDELFACLECKKEFATKKSIEKIASILALQFSSDYLKEYSLYCCADCKAKIMMLKHASFVDDSVKYEDGIKQRLKNFKESKNAIKQS